MSSTIDSVISNQRAYQAQIASKRNEKQAAGLTNSLKASEKIAKAMGFDTKGIQSALQAASGNQQQAGSPEKVSMSKEGISKLQAETAAQSASSNQSATSSTRVEKRQFKSVDEAIAYGTSRAAEKAGSRSTTKTDNTGETNSPNSQSGIAANTRAEKMQFKSVEEAISYGAQRAVDQYAKQQKAVIA